MRRSPTKRLHLRYLLAWLAGCWFCAATAQQVPPMVLLLQPGLAEGTARLPYEALARYLEQATGARLRLVVSPNFLAHWDSVRRDSGYDLVFDDAHFTDYRVQKFGFEVLAKLPGNTSYSLVARRDKRILDPFELIGKPVASFGPPSIGATRLSAMFPNPARRPTMVEIASVGEGLDLLERGRVNAAVLPSPAVAKQVNDGRLLSVMSSEPTPNIALSASPRINPVLREKIRAALLGAEKSGDGARALRDAGIERFEPASADIYLNQSRILKDYWGY